MDFEYVAYNDYLKIAKKLEECELSAECFQKLKKIGITRAGEMLACSEKAALAYGEDAKWITAWGTAPTEIGIDGYDNITAYIGNVTARTVITPTANGSKLRIRVSNAYGDKDLKLTRVTVAKSLGGSKIETGSLKSVTFNEGQPFVSVPAGKELLSDPISFEVKAGEPIAISIFVEDFTEIKTMGLSGGDTYLSLPIGDRKDFTEQESMDVGTVLEGEEIMDYLAMIAGGDIDIKLAYGFIKVVPCLASVEVLADENAYSVVVVGDSTVANEFPQYLGEVVSNKKIKNVGVVGKGIIGNRLLGEGLGYGSLIYGDSLIDRFNRDVLSQTGVKYVVVKIGANDIIHPVCKDIQEQYPGIKQPTSKEIIAGYKKIFNMCHEAGIKVVVMGITPWKGATRDYFGTEPKYVRTAAQFEADWKIAEEVNAWLAKTKLHDGFVDVNSYSANPKDTAAFMPEYTIDGIHPSDEMQRVWAEKFPLSLIGVGKTVGGIRINKTSATAYVGDKITLKTEVYPATAKNKKVIWSSSNTKVLKVSSKGVVTCVGGGKATVICKTDEGGYTVRCEITVRVKPSGVKLNKTAATVYTTK
ncbi:MAG: Ig-like domain-containing protein, partial [Clostridia bacterium]|nr:Ig-like domain-containing protein [Clostridia bacterium]